MTNSSIGSLPPPPMAAPQNGSKPKKSSKWGYLKTPRQNTQYLQRLSKPPHFSVEELKLDDEDKQALFWLRLMGPIHPQELMDLRDKASTPSPRKVVDLTRRGLLSHNDEGIINLTAVGTSLVFKVMRTVPF